MRETRRPVMLGPLRINVATWVYTTVTLMSVLTVYDGWADLIKPAGIALLVVGPTVALALAHTFAEGLDYTVEHGRGISWDRAKFLIGEFLQFVMVAVPPLVVLAVTAWVLQKPPRECLRSMLVLGVLSLGFWGALAGWRSGMRDWRLLVSTVLGLGLGLVVFAFQLVLKPH